MQTFENTVTIQRPTKEVLQCLKPVDLPGRGVPSR